MGIVDCTLVETGRCNRYNMIIIWLMSSLPTPGRYIFVIPTWNIIFPVIFPYKSMLNQLSRNYLITF